MLRPPPNRPRNRHLLLALVLAFPLLLLAGVGMLVALVVVIGWGQQTVRGVTGLFLSATVLVAGYPVAVAAHELGHAVVAATFGWPIIAVRVGPVVVERVGGRWRFRWNWRANWLSGIALANPAQPTRRRLVAFVLAGPAVSLLCGGLMAFALGGGPGWVRCPAVAVAACSLVLGWGSLLPMRHRGLDSDGRILILLWLNPGWVGLANAGATRQQVGLPSEP